MAEENKGETTTLSSVIRSGKKTVYFIAFFFSDIPRAATATGAKAEFIFSGPLSRCVVPRFSRRARLWAHIVRKTIYRWEIASRPPTLLFSHNTVVVVRETSLYFSSRRSMFFPSPLSRPRPFLISMIYAPRRRKSATLFPVVASPFEVRSCIYNTSFCYTHWHILLF